MSWLGCLPPWFPEEAQARNICTNGTSINDIQFRFKLSVVCMCPNRKVID